jgi:hypothetical protein
VKSLLAGAMPPGVFLGLVCLLLGVAYAEPTGAGLTVQTGVGSMAVGDITVPVAIAMVAGQIGRVISVLQNWTPRIVVEHRHMHIDGDPSARN